MTLRQKKKKIIKLSTWKMNKKTNYKVVNRARQSPWPRGGGGGGGGQELQQSCDHLCLIGGAIFDGEPPRDSFLRKIGESSCPLPFRGLTFLQWGHTGHNILPSLSATSDSPEDARPSQKAEGQPGLWCTHTLQVNCLEAKTGWH